MSTLDVLESLQADESPRRAFHRSLEEPIVSALFDHPQFVEVGLLRPEHFESHTCKYVVANLLNYLEKYKVLPTREALWSVLEHMLTEDDPWEPVQRLIFRPSNPREIPLVKDKMREWLRDAAYGQLFSDDVIEAYHRGEYHVIEDIVSRAARIYSFEQGEVFGFQDAEDFLEEDLSHEWLIRDILVEGQPFLLGGKKKCLKTAILCDLALSLATATPFLGHFDVPQPRRVAFFSAESGKQDIQNRMKAIRQQKRTNRPLRDQLSVSFQRPKLSDQEDLQRIRDFIARKRIEVMIVDPLYLTILAGTKDVSASDLYQMGGVYGDVADAITNAGATPALSHHFKKTVGKDDTDLDLDDFSFVGAAEFARQSLLIGRRGSYNGPRNNQLVVRTHGFGRGERYSVRIDEGTVEEPRWSVMVELERETVTRERRTKAQQDVADLREALAGLVEQNQGQGVVKQRLREELGWSGAKVSKVLVRALARGAVTKDTQGPQSLYSVREAALPASIAAEETDDGRS
jgi:hypothetical protein